MKCRICKEEHCCKLEHWESPDEIIKHNALIKEKEADRKAIRNLVIFFVGLFLLLGGLLCKLWYDDKEDSSIALKDEKIAPLIHSQHLEKL